VAALVIDCSVAIAWLMPDERTAAVDRALDLTAEHGAVVPAHWRLEVANALIVAERRRRIAPAFRRDCLAALSALAIKVDARTDEQCWTAGLALAQQMKLTIYDAAYLELALRLGLPLATLDDALRAAARRRRVELLGP
jgi:predicted nucleic acid-binding protein